LLQSLLVAKRAHIDPQAGSAQQYAQPQGGKYQHLARFISARH
jgi:hypothetical protein